MAFNLEMLKKHKIGVGIVVVAGGIAVLYVLSSRGSTASAAPSGDSDILAAESAQGQAQAAVAVQTNAQNAAIQQAQINASVQNQQTSAGEDVADTQTLASLVAALDSNKTNIAVTQSNNDTAVALNADTLTAQQNIFSIQEAGLEDQINQASQENANNNATSLAALVDQLNAQGQIATQVIGDSYNLSTQQQQYTEENTQALIPTFGKQYNSGLDASAAAAETLTVLSGGNPGVAGAGVVGTSSVANTGTISNASIINSISKLGASIGAGLLA